MFIGRVVCLYNGLLHCSRWYGMLFSVARWLAPSLEKVLSGIVTDILVMHVLSLSPWSTPIFNPRPDISPTLAKSVWKGIEHNCVLRRPANCQWPSRDTNSATGRKFIDANRLKRLAGPLFIAQIQTQWPRYQWVNGALNRTSSYYTPLRDDYHLSIIFFVYETFYSKYDNCLKLHIHSLHGTQRSIDLPIN